MILFNTLLTTIEKAEVIEFYKTLLDNQSSNYSNLITFFMGITALLIGASVFGNFYLAKNQIKKEVEEQIKDIEKSLDTKYNEILKDEVERIEILLENRHLKNEAIQRMALAVQALDQKNYTGAVIFLSSALKKCIKHNDSKMIRQCINTIQAILLDKEKVLLIKTELLNYDEIIDAINRTPNTLNIEKEFILKELNLLKVRI